MIWLGAYVSPNLLNDLWGVEDVQELDTRMVSPIFLPKRNVLVH